MKRLLWLLTSIGLVALAVEHRQAGGSLEPMVTQDAAVGPASIAVFMTVASRDGFAGDLVAVGNGGRGGPESRSRGFSPFIESRGQEAPAARLVSAGYLPSRTARDPFGAATAVVVPLGALLDRPPAGTDAVLLVMLIPD